MFKKNRISLKELMDDVTKARRLHLLSALSKEDRCVVENEVETPVCVDEILTSLLKKDLFEQALVFLEIIPSNDFSRTIPTFEKQFSVRLFFVEDDPSFFVIEGESRNVERAKVAIQQLLQQSPSPASLDSLSLADSSMPEVSLHVFVDNSNITIGARRFHDGLGRLNVSALVDIVESGRNCETRVVVGSSKISSLTKYGIWKKWKSRGYIARIGCLQKVSGKSKEVFVDDALHASIAKVILNQKFCNKAHTIVLLSGDGNANNGGNSFPLLLEAAIQRGFQVEIWCWMSSCSGNLKKLSEYEGAKLIFLDKFVDEVTFAKKLDSDSECVVCLDKQSKVSFHPCNHKVLCRKCASNMELKTCPLCRTEIKSKRW